MTQAITEKTVDRLQVKIYKDRSSLGAAAANDAARLIRSLLKKQDFVNIIFAAAPSQHEFLQNLCGEKDIAWERVNAFHMDEYTGLSKDDPKSFAFFLKERIFGRLPFREVHYLEGDAPDPEAECRRYAGLLSRNPANIVCMGIGENTHLAFNDPHVADFQDPQQVKIVHLDPASRMQQVHDGCFADIKAVPVRAITLTLPAMLAAGQVFCMVPGSSKAPAVFYTLNSEIKEDHPSTALRKHPHAILYVDKDSAAKICTAF